MAACTPVKTPTLNTDTNKTLHDLTYKELQNMCMTFNLPANLKVRFLCNVQWLAFTDDTRGIVNRMSVSFCDTEPCNLP